MAISLVGSKTATGTGTGAKTISLTDLTGGSDTAPSAGDLVVICHVAASNTNLDVTVNTSGYTEEADIYTDDTSDTNFGIYHKVMGGTPDTSVEVSGSGAGNQATTTAIMVFRGVDSTTPMDAAVTTSSVANSWNANPPPITPVTTGAWIVVCGGGAHTGGAGITYSTPSGISGFITVAANSTIDALVGMGYHDAWTSGSYDPGFMLATPDSGLYSNAAATLALRPTALNNYTLTANAGSYTLTGIAANLLKGYAVQAETGSYAISGQTASFLRGYVLGADVGSYSIGGQAANLLKGSLLTADAGSYAITGQSASLSRFLSLAAETGSYTITGQGASFSRTYRLPADAGSYAIGGQPAALLKGSLLTASPGSYDITGQSASLLRKYTLSAETGTYTLTGQTADLKVGYVLSAAAGSYSVTGIAAALKKGYRLTAETGSYAITGKDVQFFKSAVGVYTLLADTGNYAITGIPASLSYSGEEVSASEIITRRRRRRAV